ncbi:MAG TPA: hypothetical protein VD996_15015 [Chitinophagaceae bacterium]|nr:hypothetical protein [Chitinophagaceae bacterium]
MHEREFEKNVQQKMQELRFKPGADVWARVEADIRKKRRRRPVALWLLLAALLAGGGTWVFMSSSEGDTQQHIVQKTPVVQETGKPQVRKAEKATSSKNTSVEDAITQPVTQSVTAPKTKKQTTSRKLYTQQNNTSETTRSNNKHTQNQTRDVVKQETGNQETETHKTETQKTVNQDSNTQGTELPLKDTPAEQAVEAPVKDSAAKPAAATPVTAKSLKKTSKPSWQWGVTAGAGISDLGNDLFKRTTVADFAYAAPSALPYTVRRPSEVRTGMSMYVGGYVSKGISKKLRIKLGVQYENYSNNIKVGSYIDSARLVNQGANGFNVVRDFYDAGRNNKYSNKYHFISVPASLQWQLNRNQQHGIVWENGIAFSQLLGSNALHYDGVSGSYYKDDNAITKTQWMLSSSLMYSVRTKNKLQVYIGPQIQYGLSNLVKNDAGDNKHIRYAGVKLMVGFNKKQ